MRKAVNLLRPLLVILVVIMLVGISCGLIEPTVMIDSPEDGTSLPPGNVTITVDVSNFELTDTMAEPNESGEGHVIYYMDVEPPTNPGQSALTEPGTYVATPETSHTWTNVSPGTHTFSAQLVNNDNTTLESAAADTIEVSVEIAGQE